MKALEKAPEAAGRRPGLAGRSGPASFSGPSSRTKAGGAAGAGAPVSGALGAALLAAALLLAPGDARAIEECGRANLNTNVTCSGASYPDGIFYGGVDTAQWLAGNNRVTIAGSSTATTTITATDTGTATQQSVGVYTRGGTGAHDWAHIIIGGETDGTAHVVNIVQGTSTNWTYPALVDS